MKSRGHTSIKRLLMNWNSELNCRLNSLCMQSVRPVVPPRRDSDGILMVDVTTPRTHDRSLDCPCEALRQESCVSNAPLRQVLQFRHLSDAKGRLHFCHA